MSTLDEGLMAKLTQEERDAMKEDDATTESVDSSEQPVDEANLEIGLQRRRTWAGR